MSKYRILTIDGGGLRGLISARLLQRLNQDPVVKDWLDSVDLVVGTSTGGIIALGIAAGKTLEEICDLYVDRGSEIFSDSIWDDIKDVGKTIGADYSNRILKRELKSLFRSTKLSDLNCKAAITAFDLDNEAEEENERTWKPKIFHNFLGNDSDGDQLVKDIALYTCSAPTYFPSADGYIDGGVFANNPSVVALTQAMSANNRKSERADQKNIVLLSIGTGVNQSYIKGRNLNWGYAQWSKPLLRVLMSGVSGVADYQAKQLLGRRYHRLQVKFAPGESIVMDAVEKLSRMNEIGLKQNLTSTRNWLKSYWFD